MILKGKPDFSGKGHRSLESFFPQFIVLCENLTKHWKNKVLEKDELPPQPEDKAYISSVSM